MHLVKFGALAFQRLPLKDFFILGVLFLLPLQLPCQLAIAHTLVEEFGDAFDLVATERLFLSDAVVGRLDDNYEIRFFDLRVVRHLFEILHRDFVAISAESGHVQFALQHMQLPSE